MNIPQCDIMCKSDDGRLNRDMENSTSPLVVKAGLTLIFLSGLLYVTSLFKQYYAFVLLLGIIFIWFGTGMSFILTFQKDSMEFTYFICSVFILVSAFIHSEASMVISGLGLLLLWIALNMWIPYNEMGIKPYAFLLPALILSHMLILIPSLRYFTLNGFEGLFTNRNGMGGATSTLSAILIAQLLEELLSKRLNIIRVATIGSSILVLFFFCLASLSRTSFIAIVVMLVVAILILLKNVMTDVQLLTRMFLITVGIIFVVVILYRFSDLKVLWINLQNKFVAKQDDQLSGRGEIWSAIIARLSFWGNGESTSIGAHNTFLSLLDQYGIIPFVSWILFVITGTFKSIKIALVGKTRHKLKYLPCFTFVCFDIEAFAEGMMMKTIMLLAVACVSIIREYDALSCHDEKETESW